MPELEELDRYRAPALDKGLDILELLATAEAGLSQAEIAKALERSANEIYRMLDRLVRRGYVRRTSAERYELTLKLFELAHARPPLERLISQALPVMRQLARDAQQECHLSIHDRGALVIAAQVDGPGYWNVSLRIGARLSLVGTGSGRVMLAFSTPEERRQMLAEEEDGPVELPAGLDAALERVRSRGHDEMQSLQIEAVTNLAVPILGPMGRVLAVLACPYSARLDVAGAPGRDEVVALLSAAAHEISQRRSDAEPMGGTLR